MGVRTRGDGAVSNPTSCSPRTINRTLSAHRMMPKAYSKVATPQNAAFSRMLKHADSFNPDSSNLDPLIVGLAVEFKTRASSKTMHHGTVTRINRERDEYDIYCEDEDGKTFENIKRFNVRYNVAGNEAEESEDSDDDDWINAQKPLEGYEGAGGGVGKG